MSITRCPSCGYEVREPEPEWVDELEVFEELCPPCERELYGEEGNETRIP